MAFAEDYNDVPARIREFREKHPSGSLQSEVIRWPEDGFPFIAVEARAYRMPEDERPGVGLAYEPFPGKTNFTRDSELQNAETSAWGRAIVAVGAADTKKGISSAEDVRNRQSSGGAGGSPGPAIAPSDPMSAESEDTGTSRNAGKQGKGGDPGEVALPFPELWQSLTDWFDGSKVRARNAVARANKIDVTANTEHEVTEAQLEAAIKFVAEN